VSGRPVPIPAATNSHSNRAGLGGGFANWGWLPPVEQTHLYLADASAEIRIGGAFIFSSVSFLIRFRSGAIGSDLTARITDCAAVKLLANPKMRKGCQRVRLQIAGKHQPRQ
jgi:hypothetical protein